MKRLLLILILLSGIYSICSAAEIKSPFYYRYDSVDYKVKIPMIDINTEIIDDIAITKYHIKIYSDDPLLNDKSSPDVTFELPLESNCRIYEFEKIINSERLKAVIGETQREIKVDYYQESSYDYPAYIKNINENNARISVYPLKEKDTVEFFFTIESSLKTENGSLIYELPFMLSDTINNFSLSIKLNEESIYKNVQIENSSISNISSNIKYLAENYVYSPKKFAIKNSSDFALKTECFMNEIYYQYEFSPNLQSKKLPKRICIIYDISNSAHVRNINKEIELLKEYFKNNKNCEVTLVPFSIFTEAEKKFKIKNGNADELFNYIQSLNLDGASDYSSININEKDFDEVFFFSDGSDTFLNNHLSIDSLCVYTISSNEIPERNVMNNLSKNCFYIDLYNSDIKTAVKVLTTKFIDLVNTRYSNTYDNFYIPIYSPNLNIRYNGKLKDISKSIIINDFKTKLTADNIKDYGGYIHRNWAKQKLDSICLNQFFLNDEIFYLSCKHRIISKYTSFMIVAIDDIYCYWKRIELPDSTHPNYEKILKQIEEFKKEELEYEASKANRFQKDFKYWEETKTELLKNNSSNLSDTAKKDELFSKLNKIKVVNLYSNDLNWYLQKNYSYPFVIENSEKLSNSLSFYRYKILDKYRSEENLQVPKIDTNSGLNPKLFTFT